MISPFSFNFLIKSYRQLRVHHQTVRLIQQQHSLWDWCLVQQKQKDKVGCYSLRHKSQKMNLSDVQFVMKACTSIRFGDMDLMLRDYQAPLIKH